MFEATAQACFEDFRHLVFNAIARIFHGRPRRIAQSNFGRDKRLCAVPSEPHFSSVVDVVPQ